MVMQRITRLTPLVGLHPPRGFRTGTVMQQVARLTGAFLVGGWVVAGLAVVLFSFAPKALGHQVLIVRSGSMEPAIMTGSVVIVQPVPPSALRVGDVITFEPPDGSGRVMTHRIVGVLEEGQSPAFQTRGDANSTFDSLPVRYASTGWKVVGSVPYAGYFYNLLGHPAARAILIGVPAMLLSGAFLRDLWRSAQ
jgi:signal peptidase I